ncbi:core histone h2A/H2B/H3/H4 domain-containing protein [Ditylenchus destructor]|nr:core histone h2A/H2B/H3/H4 domain-containing protein [Ditylenchus destructor]
MAPGKQKTHKATTPKESKKAAVKGSGKKRTGKKSYKSFSVFLYRVLKQVNPECGISSKGMAVMNSMMNDVFERLADEGARLSKMSSRSTLSSREVQSAARLVLPGELAKHAVSEGTKAVTNRGQTRSFYRQHRSIQSHLYWSEVIWQKYDKNIYRTARMVTENVEQMEIGISVGGIIVIKLLILTSISLVIPLLCLQLDLGVAESTNRPIKPNPERVNIVSCQFPKMQYNPTWIKRYQHYGTCNESSGIEIPFSKCLLTSALMFHQPECRLENYLVHRVLCIFKVWLASEHCGCCAENQAHSPVLHNQLSVSRGHSAERTCGVGRTGDFSLPSMEHSTTSTRTNTGGSWFSSTASSNPNSGILPQFVGFGGAPDGEGGDATPNQQRMAAARKVFDALRQRLRPWSTEIKHNLQYFTTNYLCLVVILLIYCIITSLLMLLTLIVLGGLIYTIYNRTQKGLVVMDRRAALSKVSICECRECPELRKKNLHALLIPLHS